MADITLQALDVSVLPVEEDAPYATLAALTGVQTPFGGPDGQAVALPTDIYRIPMGKQAIKKLIEEAQAAYDALPDPKPQSNLVVPGNPNDVDKIANDLKRVTGR
jgi:hypothetical protein